MKKIGLLVKDVLEKRIRDSLSESSAAFIIKYSGLSSPSLTTLRQALKNSNARLLVVKNSVAGRLFRDLGRESLAAAIEGPCGLVFAKEEPVGASKVLWNFLKEHEQLKLEGGLLQDKVLDKKDIELIACLPSKEILRAKVVMALNSPLSGFVITLNQVLRKFVYCLEQIKQKKSAAAAAKPAES